MDQLLATTSLAVLNTALWEALLKPIRTKKPELDLWWMVYVTWITGAALSYLAHLNLFAEAVSSLPVLAGEIVTALVVGGGSQLIYAVLPKKDTQGAGDGA